MAANPYTTNLELELNAKDISATDGDSITTWTDSSAAGNDATQSTSSRRPVYKTSIIGSHPVVRFTTDSTKSLYGSFASSWSGFGGATVLMLAQFYEIQPINNGGIFVLHDGADSDTNSADNVLLYTGISNNVVNHFSRSQLNLYYNGSYAVGGIGTLRPGAPSLLGFAMDTSATGVKFISELGGYTTSDSFQYTGTPTNFVLGNRFQSGSVSAVYGYRADIAMLLIYKEYVSDSNITLVKNWMLSEYDAHTQSASGGGGLIRSQGMSGGMNG